jgi:hypothetical protein
MIAINDPNLFGTAASYKEHAHRTRQRRIIVRKRDRHATHRSLLKSAVVAFFNLARCGAKLRTEAQNNPGAPGLFWHRIHAMRQPIEFFNGLIAPVWRSW